MVSDHDLPHLPTI